MEAQTTRDCSKVVCNVPLCGPDHEYFTPEGECCPMCRPIVRQNCDGVRCPFTPCERGQTIFFPEEECCSRCIDFPVDCRAKRCSRPLCGPGQELFTPRDQCCPICRDVTIDCTGATCYTPRCSSDQVFSPEGFCCPQCRNTFADLFCRDIPSTCSIPPCGYGQTTTALERECCNHGRCCPTSCRQAPTKNCAAISCYPLRECEETYTVEGECCPRCRNIPLIDCGYVRCSLPECDLGQELATTPGQCCPTCHDIPRTTPPNCDATVCPEVWCGQEKEKYCPQDECCCRCR